MIRFTGGGQRRQRRRALARRGPPSTCSSADGLSTALQVPRHQGHWAACSAPRTEGQCRVAMASAGSRKQDPYAVLGVSRAASEEEVKAAFRKLGKQPPALAKPAMGAAKQLVT